MRSPRSRAGFASRASASRGLETQQPGFNGLRQLVEHLLAGPARALETRERVVCALHHVERGPITEAIQDRPQEIELGERIARALQEEHGRGHILEMPGTSGRRAARRM